jgi:hypothetical protein
MINININMIAEIYKRQELFCEKVEIEEGHSLAFS